MPLVLGLNHETAPVSLREQLTVAGARLTEMFSRLKKSITADELVILSTCNRMEVYVRSADHPSTRQALLQEFQTHAPRQPLDAHLYYHENGNAVRHLFRVASGLDSMVKGEHEILAQVKQAYLSAQSSGLTGKLMNVLFQRSLYVGKRVRTETGLSYGSSSVGSVAVAMAERIFGDLKNRCVMILGAGEMAERAVKHLLSQKVGSIVVANRTFDQAERLAMTYGGRALSLDDGLKAMAQADIVICSTSAEKPIVTPEIVRAVMGDRRGRSLFIIDIAMPRNVDPVVHNIDNVYLYNIDDLQNIVDENREQRSKEMIQAERIVETETEQFSRWLEAQRLGIPLGLKHSSSPRRVTSDDRSDADMSSG